MASSFQMSKHEYPHPYCVRVLSRFGGVVVVVLVVAFVRPSFTRDSEWHTLHGFKQDRI